MTTALETQESRVRPAPRRGPHPRLASRLRCGLRPPLLCGLAQVAAAALLLVSLSLPWWSIVLHAPQYPGGLRATVYLTRVTGDVDEIDELNHYIGMMKLNDAAPLEKRMVPYAVPAFAALAVISALLPGVWGWLLRLPLVTFPLVFVLDLAAWLWYAGNHLDPRAAMSSSIKGFTPAVVGSGKIAQFSTTASFEIGFYLALGATLLSLAPALLRAARKKGGGRR